MPDDMDWIVPMPPVRGADRLTRLVGLALPPAQRTVRVAELRRQVREGYYATESMMEAVARRIIERGGL